MFPTTRGSVLQALRSADERERERARGTIAAAYWRPAWAYLRLQWKLSPEDASDAVQGFLARALEKDVLERHDPARASFRTFLRACLDNHVVSERRQAGREKRGGGGVLSLDLGWETGEPSLEPAGGLSPEELFHREWVRGLWTLAWERLQRRLGAAGRDAQVSLLRRCELDPAEGAPRPSYAELADELGLSVTQVTNHLATARRELRAELQSVLRELTASDDEYRAEARALFGEKGAR